MKYKQLPIYKSSYDMLLRIMQLIKHFPREYKYTLGEKIQKEAIDLILSIYKPVGWACKCNGVCKQLL